MFGMRKPNTPEPTRGKYLVRVIGASVEQRIRERHLAEAANLARVRSISKGRRRMFLLNTPRQVAIQLENALNAAAKKPKIAEKIRGMLSTFESTRTFSPKDRIRAAKLYGEAIKT